MSTLRLKHVHDRNSISQPLPPHSLQTLLLPSNQVSNYPLIITSITLLLLSPPFLATQTTQPTCNTLTISTSPSQPHHFNSTISTPPSQPHHLNFTILTPPSQLHHLNPAISNPPTRRPLTLPGPRDSIEWSQVNEK